jgi:general secretion pathway protein E/type IV pilus assembly protein PilB
VAVSDPLDIDTIDSLSFLLQRELELVCTSPEKIHEALIKYYGTAEEAADVLKEKLGEGVDLGLEIGDGAAIPVGSPSTTNRSSPCAPAPQVNARHRIR